MNFAHPLKNGQCHQLHHLLCSLLSSPHLTRLVAVRRRVSLSCTPRAASSRPASRLQWLTTPHVAPPIFCCWGFNIGRRVKMVAAFPLGKLIYLGIRQLSKPIAVQLRNSAARHPFVRRYICAPPAQSKYTWQCTHRGRGKLHCRGHMGSESILL